MLLEASCHCQRVSFTCESHEPYPYLRCYCSICRKLAGSGGYGINIGADFTSLVILKGGEYIHIYSPTSGSSQSWEEKGIESGRHFCNACGTGLWNWDKRWPNLFHPYASVIDTDLPTPPENTHMMIASKATWTEPQISEKDRVHDAYPEESLHEWHERATGEKRSHIK